MKPRVFCFVDTETTGLVRDDLDVWHTDQARLVQLSAVLYLEGSKRERSSIDVIVNPGVHVPEAATKVHGITTADTIALGVAERTAVTMLVRLAQRADVLVAHHLKFDENALVLAANRADVRLWLPPVRRCTMEEARDLCRIPPTERMIAAGRTGFKSPSLAEAYRALTGDILSGAHSSAVDVRACASVFWAIEERLSSSRASERGNNGENHDQDHETEDHKLPRHQGTGG